MLLFKPFLEGMALFSEFDVRSGASRVVSEPMRWAMITSCDRTAFPPDLATLERATTERLISIRLGRSGIVRKSNALTFPQGDGDRHYIHGYLAVKRMFHELRARVHLFEDRDFFLNYLKWYIFEDPSLVVLLLRSEDSPFQRQARILEHVGGRFEGLEDVSDTDAAMFEAAMDRPPSEPIPVTMPGLGFREDDALAAARLIEQVRSVTTDGPGESLEARVWRDWCRLTLDRRGTVAHAAVEALRITVRNGQFSAWPDPRDDEMFLCAGSALSGVGDCDDAVGWGTVVVVPARPGVASVLGIGDKVVAIQALPHDDSFVAQLRGYLDHPWQVPRNIDQQLETMRSVVRTALDQLPDEWKRNWETAETSVVRHTRRITDYFVDRWRTKSLEPRFSSLIDSEGLYPLLRGRASTLMDILALGCMDGLDVFERQRFEVLQSIGCDVVGALTAATELEENFGVRLVRNEDGLFRWLL